MKTSLSKDRENVGRGGGVSSHSRKLSHLLYLLIVQQIYHADQFAEYCNLHSS